MTSVEGGERVGYPAPETAQVELETEDDRHHVGCAVVFGCRERMHHHRRDQTYGLWAGCRYES